jgi:beta-glucosidase/6-phospho-beta-glucosidase/beta-galactosidase
LHRVEGAWNADGKGESIWDVFVREPGKIADNATGDVANDFYHRYASGVRVPDSLHPCRTSLSYGRVRRNIISRPCAVQESHRTVGL